MASGNEHDRATKVWSIPFGLVLWLFLDVYKGLIGGIAFVIGGLWLSPDLDTKSNALKRWGLFSFIWIPYRKLIPHRSIISHAPLLGTAVRVGYLICIASLLIFISQFTGLQETTNIWEKITRSIGNNNIYWIILLGLEASSWLHLIKDGDP